MVPQFLRKVSNELPPYTAPPNARCPYPSQRWHTGSAKCISQRLRTNANPIKRGKQLPGEADRKSYPILQITTAWDSAVPQGQPREEQS
jgi:hypothetical protein